MDLADWMDLAGWTGLADCRGRYSSCHFHFHCFVAAAAGIHALHTSDPLDSSRSWPPSSVDDASEPYDDAVASAEATSSAVVDTGIADDCSGGGSDGIAVEVVGKVLVGDVAVVVVVVLEVVA